jgi:hypothetical protein
MGVFPGGRRRAQQWFQPVYIPIEAMIAGEAAPVMVAARVAGRGVDRVGGAGFAG